ncbi:MAG: hypothetical protein RL172_1056 [Bacteroidota bacterium]|jgi:hypothetical protein
MNVTDFKQQILQDTAPANLSVYLLAMWYDAKGNWHKAHELADSRHDTTGNWIHAYLHRKEGDVYNAGYWYRRANRELPGCSLQQEWEDIVQTLLQNK